jgi:hypothetical protein
MNLEMTEAAQALERAEKYLKDAIMLSAGAVTVESRLHFAETEAQIVQAKALLAIADSLVSMNSFLTGISPQWGGACHRDHG